VEISINALIERADDFLTRRATVCWRRAAGIERGDGLAALHADALELSRLESFIAVKELVESPRVDETRRARLRLFHAFLGQCLVEARAAEHGDGLDELLRTHPLTSAGRRWTLGEALRETPHQAQREARDHLEHDAAAALWDQQSLFARRADVTLHAAAELGFANAEALVGFLHGRPLEPRLQAAATLLAGTADAYRDLLGYALKRLDAQLKPQVARLHDAQRAVTAPWLFELLRKEDLQHAVTRMLGDLGLHPSANGRIAIDSEARAGREPGAHRFDIAVPDSIRLLLEAGPGFEAWAGWLAAWGTAQSRANVARTLPFVERALGDTTVVSAVGRLFESLLGDAGWLMRYARLTSAQARETARLFAFRQLYELRREAALLSVSSELLARGPVRPLAEDYVSRLSAALMVEVPRGRFLHDTSPLAAHALALDAAALEAPLRAHLLERFNEDWWRNPAAGRWLVDFSSKGLRDDAPAVAKAYGAETLDVAAAGRHLMAVMGA